jgi:hypothetical protein
MQVTMDRVEGSEARRTAAGWELVRGGLVSGLSGRAEEIAVRALEAPGVPRVGEAHPTVGSVRVWSVEAEPAGPTSVTLRVRYRSPGVTVGADPFPGEGERASIEVGASLRAETVRRDRWGQAVRVLRPRQDAGAGASEAGAETQRVGQLMSTTRLTPEVTLTYRAREPESPAFKARTFTGAVNSREAFGDPPGTWLCTAIRGESDDGGLTYLVTYAFQHAAEGWNPRVYYRDPQTQRELEAGGRAPREIESGETVEIYPAREFRELGI